MQKENHNFEGLFFTGLFHYVIFQMSHVFLVNN